jgi:isochorismate hydrolase
MLGRFFSSVISCGDPDSGIVFEPRSGETIIRKTTYDSFYGTQLEMILRAGSISQVLITGVLTHLCCETTARSAFVRGFEVYAAVDAMASSSEELHLGSLLSMADGVGVMMDTASILRICGVS